VDSYQHNAPNLVRNVKESHNELIAGRRASEEELDMLWRVIERRINILMLYCKCRFLNSHGLTERKMDALLLKHSTRSKDALKLKNDWEKYIDNLNAISKKKTTGTGII
jgi:hypothetical protein